MFNQYSSIVTALHETQLQLHAVSQNLWTCSVDLVNILHFRFDICVMPCENSAESHIIYYINVIVYGLNTVQLGYKLKMSAPMYCIASLFFSEIRGRYERKNI
jgi:hypothetical protein